LKFSVVLPGSIRSKKNSKRIFSGGKFKTVLPSLAYEKWERLARPISKAQLSGILSGPLGGEIKNVKVSAYFKGQQPDLSGVLESVGDCLEGIIWVNDKQITAWDGSRLFHNKDDPRTIVEVEI